MHYPTGLVVLRTPCAYLRLRSLCLVPLDHTYRLNFSRESAHSPVASEWLPAPPSPVVAPPQAPPASASDSSATSEPTKHRHRIGLPAPLLPSFSRSIRITVSSCKDGEIVVMFTMPEGYKSPANLDGLPSTPGESAPTTTTGNGNAKDQATKPEPLAQSTSQIQTPEPKAQSPKPKPTATAEASTYPATPS
ncbi:hypothetical protein BDZ91DRAFT_794960 [Kalaharituber pfeilii]|nr:hypothetical protein BDZ91DRAFT_794960 [Kalaharituber pfeilii]